MSRGTRVLGFVGIATAASVVLLRSAPAESRVVCNADGGRVGNVIDGTDPDGGGTPSVLPAPHQATLEQLVLRASQCAVGKDGAHTILFQMEFQPDGRMANLRFTSPQEGSVCVRALFQHARVAPFAGPNRKVTAYVMLP